MKTLATIAMTMALAAPAFAGTTHTVEPGDTLFDLARRYETSVDHLMRINGLETTVIRVGQILTGQKSFALEHE